MSNDFIPFARPDIGDAEIDAMVQSVRSGWLTTGPATAAFEREFAEYIGGGVHAVSVNSATAGLHLAAEAVGIGPGDEVIVPTWTFTATAEVVRYLGADPVLVDVDPHTRNIDPEAAAAAVTSRTKAIIPVDFGGLPVAEAALRRIADDHDLKIVRDAAHALPAETNGARVGSNSFADATVYSFYATKTITTGEGGMIVTHSKDLVDRVKAMRLHGISRDVFDRYSSKKPSWFYEVVAPGYKYNLTDPASSMGRVQLSRADEMRDQRASIGARYDRDLAGLPIVLPSHAAGTDQHSWHLYVIRINPEARVNREEFIARMAEAGVGCSVHFIPLHKHPYWRDRYHHNDAQFPVASSQFEEVVSLPIFSAMTPQQVDAVATAVRNILQ